MIQRRRTMSILAIALLLLTTLLRSGAAAGGGTDFVSPTLPLPEAAPPLESDPNAIKSMPTASANSKMNLIEPPQANNNGDAVLSYPLELPPGRLGMAPTLALEYNSSNGNGWTGLGWNLALPAVSIDTRWGAPRYDAANETENYLLDGNELVPLFNRSALVARTADKVFYNRVETEFKQITRHGTGPSNYWWEVYDKSGTVYRYGDVAPDTGYTLRDGSNNIYRWALHDVTDDDGNGVLYTYTTVSSAGVSGGTVSGRELYPATINYTTSNGTAGPYTVTFYRDRELPGFVQRPDVIIDGRGGFKAVTADLLKQVKVTLNGQLIRQYDLAYQTGAFSKTLLAGITQRGEDGSVFNTHNFTYYAGSTGFAAAEAWNTGSDDISVGIPNLNFGSLNGSVPITALGGGKNTGGSGSIYIGFNLSQPDKTNSIGGKIGFGFGQSDTLLEMIDLNGDALPDKVYKSGSSHYIRLNQSGPDGSTTFGSAIALPSLPGLTQETSTEIDGGIEAYPFGANIMVNVGGTFTSGTVYFSDVNGDGLPDLVNNGTVYFNHLNASGVPTFTLNSNDTPAPILTGAAINGGVIPDLSAQRSDLIARDPLVDTLRRWTAPYDGTISISGDVTLLAPSGTPHANTDGVRVAIQKNGAELWSDSIAATDHTAHTPSGVGAVAVSKGDRIYLRVGSVFNGYDDEVSWDPQITYTAGPAGTDVNNLSESSYQASTDFVLAGRPGINALAPYAGTVHIEGALNKTGTTTDDVTLLVTKNGSSIFTGTRAWDATGSLSVNTDVTVAAGDSLAVRVQVDSPIDLSKLQWSPNIDMYYTSAVDDNGATVPVQDSSGTYQVQLDPPADIDIYPLTDLSATQATYTVPTTGTATITPSVTGLVDASGTVVFTVKKQGVRLAKESFTVTAGVGTGAPLSVAVTAGDKLYFDVSVYDATLSSKLTSASASFQYGGGGTTSVPTALHLTGQQGIFPLAYRGWAVAGYNGNTPADTQPIDESKLAVTTTDLSTNCTMGAGFDQAALESSSCPLASSTPPGSWSYSPSPAESTWKGPNSLLWASAGGVSSSRIGAPSIDIPTASELASASAVRKFSSTIQGAFGAGFSFASYSVGGGSGDASIDYIDLNGDGYPDVVGSGSVQYSLPSGGLEGSTRSGPSSFRGSTAFGQVFGPAGNPAEFNLSSSGEGGANGKGATDTGGAAKGKGGKGGKAGGGGGGKGAPGEEDSGGQSVTLGFSGGLGFGTTDLSYDLIDMNGDGLPDRVVHSGGQIQVGLNLGYGFAALETWGSGAINPGASRAYSLGISPSFSDGVNGFGGGISFDGGTEQAACTGTDIAGDCSSFGSVLADVNGDGLPDVLHPGGTWSVNLNTGNGFASAISWSGAQQSGHYGFNTQAGMGGGFDFTIGIGPLCLVTCYLIINPGASYSTAASSQNLALTDVDGDGFPDHVYSTSDGQMMVARNRAGQANLLQTVTRPLGATISLSYQRTGNTVDMPQSHWVLSRVLTTDAHTDDGVDTQETTFTYSGGVWNRQEREFYGFGQVVEQIRDFNNASAIYRTITRTYRTDSYYNRGLLTSERLADAAGNLWTETENTYSQTIVDLALGRIFPHLDRVDRYWYEGQATAGMSTYTTYTYDSRGNVTTTADAGDPAVASDNQITTVSYSNCPTTHIFNQPIYVQVTDGNGNVLGHREATYDCAGGEYTQYRDYPDTNPANVAVTDVTVYANGTIQTITQPPNGTGQRYAVTYTYDGTLSAYPVSTTDSFGLTATASYNLKYGLPASETDVNGNVTTYAYDAYGRLSSVTGPYEQGGANASLRFDYYPFDPVPWARTRRLDTLRSPAAYIHSVEFIDGLGRVIQTKQETAVFTAAGSPAERVMTVSGKVVFDLVGRIVEQYVLHTEPWGTEGTFNPDPEVPTTTTYDVLDRVLTVTRPDGALSTNVYGFGQDQSGADRFRQQSTGFDEITTRTYRDVRQQVTGSERVLPGGTSIWSGFTYNAAHQLTQVSDDQNNVIQIAYDSMGRRTRVESPDTGRTDFAYDTASNLTRKTPANLQSAGQYISYAYDYNRLKDIVYPTYPANNVHYTYGGPGAANNGAGRITQVSDGVGTEQRSYGKLGELTGVTRVITTTYQGYTNAVQSASFNTQFSYDSLGRLQTITYPDGEVLTYTYDGGGRIQSATGVKNGQSTTYLQERRYDQYGRVVFSQTGDGVQDTFSYDPITGFVTSMRSGIAGAPALQDVSYTWDTKGNLLRMDYSTRAAGNFNRVTDSSGVTPDSNVQTFQYDDLNRLVSASGTYKSNASHQRRYTLAMTYDSIDNLLTKQQVDMVWQDGATYTTPAPNTPTSTYNFSYQYGSSRPHAPTQIGGRTYQYDNNGNQTSAADNPTRPRTLAWDEDDRLLYIKEGKEVTAFRYGESGLRMWKRGILVEEYTPNPYFSVRTASQNSQVITKYIFVGQDRVAARQMVPVRFTGNVTLTNLSDRSLYFFHGNPIGSNTYVTGSDGRIHQHVEYLPTGEAWVTEGINPASGGGLPPHRFVDKPWDGETGLYYFGKRYFDPRAGVWQNASAPLLGLLDGERGGVFDPQNLSLYAYAHQNPLNHIDPDGLGTLPAAPQFRPSLTR